MSILIDYISTINEPEWLILTYKLKCWQIKKVNMRITFNYKIKDDNHEYEIHYNVEEDDIIYCYPRPKSLLQNLGFDPNDDDFWEEEQRKLLRIFLSQHESIIKRLKDRRPQKPKWYQLIF